MASNSKTKPSKPGKETKKSKNKKKHADNDNERTVAEGFTEIFTNPKKLDKKRKSKSTTRVKADVTAGETGTKASARGTAKPSQINRSGRKEPTSAEVTQTELPPLVNQPVTLSPISPVDITAITREEKDPKPLEKWDGEECARGYISKIDPSSVMKEFAEVSAIVADESKCTIWKANMNKNQSDKYPCFDANIVKNQNSPGEYTNASYVNVPNITKPLIIGQIPRKEVAGALEEFWNTIFQNNVTLLTVLSGDDELVDFFPQVTGAYENYGTMFVNNRKVSRTDSGAIRFIIEVLPTGMSNSILTNVLLHHKWNSLIVPTKYAPTTRAVNEVVNFAQSGTGCPDDRAMILSKHGAGRSGFFAALASAFSCLNMKQEPKIVDIVKKLREQRPLAVESVKQYISIYLNVIYYIKKKIGDKSLDAKFKELTESLSKLSEE